LALITFIITTVSANKNYWLHIVATPGVPSWLLPLMIPIEIIGMFSKPIVLCLRLFANITAGHIIILAFMSLIFIFSNLYGAGAGYGASILSLLFAIFMNLMELLVAFLQAYVFTLLSALYFGMAVEEHH
jgi:F-type H+-transporting ATPase subunit a